MDVRRKILRCWNPDEMNGDIVRGAVLAMGVLVATVPLTGQMPGSTGCQSDIVSATVVTTSCTHAERETQVLDLLVLWRGRPGWFQDAGGAGSGVGGSSTHPPQSKGQVSHWVRYGDVTIAFSADFDAQTVTIDESAIRLDAINTVLMDDVDIPGRRAISRTIRVDPVLPLTADTNLALAQRSRDVRDYLQCQVPMPRPAGRIGSPPLQVITVCEKLQRLR